MNVTARARALWKVLRGSPDARQAVDRAVAADAERTTYWRHVRALLRAVMRAPARAWIPHADDRFSGWSEPATPPVRSDWHGTVDDPYPAPTADEVAKDWSRTAEAFDLTPAEQRMCDDARQKTLAKWKRWAR